MRSACIEHAKKREKRNRSGRRGLWGRGGMDVNFLILKINVKKLLCEEWGGKRADPDESRRGKEDWRSELCLLGHTKRVSSPLSET